MMFRLIDLPCYSAHDLVSLGDNLLISVIALAFLAITPAWFKMDQDKAQESYLISVIGGLGSMPYADCVKIVLSTIQDSLGSI